MTIGNNKNVSEITFIMYAQSQMIEKPNKKKIKKRTLIKIS